MLVGNRNFVRLSHACFVTKLNEELRIVWYHTKKQPLCYSDTNSGVGGRRLLPSEICAQMTHSLQNTPTSTDFRYNVSTVTYSGKVRLWWIGSRPRVFQRAIDGVRTLPLSPPKGGSKSIFLNKSQLLSNKVCYTVSLCNSIGKVVVSPLPCLTVYVDIGAKRNPST